jgi:hypothetical protein
MTHTVPRPPYWLIATNCPPLLTSLFSSFVCPPQALPLRPFHPIPPRLTAHLFFSLRFVYLLSGYEFKRAFIKEDVKIKEYQFRFNCPRDHYPVRGLMKSSTEKSMNNAVGCSYWQREGRPIEFDSRRALGGPSLHFFSYLGVRPFFRYTRFHCPPPPQGYWTSGKSSPPPHSTLSYSVTSPF